MFSVDNAHSLTLEELTWLSASTLIENQHALSVCPYFFSPLLFSSSIQESPSPDRDSRALFNAVFSDSHSELVHVSISPTTDPSLLSCPCHRCHNHFLPLLYSFNKAGSPSLLPLLLPVAISILLDTCLMTHLLHHPPLLLPFHPLP